MTTHDDDVPDHLRRLVPTDANGKALGEIDHYPDGGSKVPDRIVEKAGILGALRLLEEIAKRDENPEYRRQARHNADELKRLVRRAARTGGLVVSDAEILGDLRLELEKKRLGHTPGKLPPASEVIDV